MRHVVPIIRTTIVGIAMIVSLVSIVALLPPADASAQASDVLLNEACRNSGGSELCDEDENSLFGPGSLFNRIINVLIFVAGLAAVLMVIVGGIRYILSNGDTAGITSAKNTILYAVSGVVVCLAAYGIVNFVIAGLVR